MKRLSLIIIFALLMMLKTNGQEINFPTEITGYNAKSPSKLLGQVKTILTVSYKGEEVFNSTVETYDLQRRKQEFISQNANIEIHSGKMVSQINKEIFIYDSKSGKLLKILSYDVDGEPIWKRVFNYDTKGRLTERIGYSSNNEISSKQSFVYYPEKMEVEETYTTYYKHPDSISSTTRKKLLAYNEKGQWTKRISFDRNGKQEDITSFEYDDKGNLIKEISCCKYNFFHTYEYKFDKQGNWIEKVESYSQKDENGNPVARESMRVYRVITYYTDTKQ